MRTKELCFQLPWQQYCFYISFATRLFLTSLSLFFLPESEFHFFLGSDFPLIEAIEFVDLFEKEERVVLCVYVSEDWYGFGVLLVLEIGMVMVCCWC